MRPQIIDSVFHPDVASEFRTWLNGQSLLHGWKARPDTKGCFWHRNYVLPGKYEHHYDTQAVSTELTFENLVKSNGPLAYAAQEISKHFFNDTPLTRVWVNVQSFGDESAIHRDFPVKFAETARTAVWYPVIEWHRDWGGDFITADDNDEITFCAAVKPNRLVLFNGTTPHAARPISRYAEQLRISVSFACEVVND
jgi:Rps23 Pro-64 3,4-dihydroxylase Tpa1-like proline 4-hydroxylase